jgi:hypothetical protein
VLRQAGAAQTLAPVRHLDGHGGSFRFRFFIQQTALAAHAAGALRSLIRLAELNGWGRRRSMTTGSPPRSLPERLGAGIAANLRAKPGGGR